MFRLNCKKAQRNMYLVLHAEVETRLIFTFLQVYF